MYTSVMSMFATITLSLALFASSALALPLSTPEPSIVTKMAISIGVPFDMASTPTAHIAARSGEWAPADTPAAPAWTAPAVWTPSPPAWTDAPQNTWVATPLPSWAPTSSATSVPTPSPSYTWAETHNDSKTTLTNGIIAGIVFGGFFALGILTFVIFTTYHRAIKPWHRARRGAGDVAAAKAGSFTSKVTGGVQMGEAPERVRVRSTEDGGFRVVETSGGMSRG